MKRPARYFRAGAAAVISDAAGRVLALERADIPGAWQFPQGGLEDDETPVEAVFREIAEETGLSKDALTLVAHYPGLLAYELPRRAQSPKTGMGQVQYWFFLTLKTPVTIRLPRDSEFRAAEWLPFERVVAGAVPFRKPVYRKLLEFFTSGFPTPDDDEP